MFKDPFSVVLGSLTDFRAEGPIDFGRFRHGMLWVGTPEGTYRCAVDVDTRLDSEPLRWRVQPLRLGEWTNLLALPDGRHQLVPARTGATQADGGTDYIRDIRLYDLIFLPEIEQLPRPPRWPFPPEEKWSAILPHRRALHEAQAFGFGITERKVLQGTIGANAIGPLRRMASGSELRIGTPMRLAGHRGEVLAVRPPWNVGTSASALTDLEAVLRGSVRVIVMGEQFNNETQERGLHNIHQNQGDIAGGGFDGENGIWHDGITIAIRADGTAAAFMNRFEDQSDNTDDSGRPA